MALETISGTAPDSWACYFLNGDSEGMTEAEQKAADQFAAWLGACPCDCEDAGFLWRPDSFQFWPYGATCQTFTALIQVPQFAELGIGDSFDWINPNLRPGLNSFFERCRKISPRRYQSDSGQVYKVGSIKAPVFHIEKVKP